MKLWPALDVTGPLDVGLIIAAVDDCEPRAVEERPGCSRLFFPSDATRQCACGVLRSLGFDARSVDVADEDWARRSQQGLTPVRIGRIVVAPPWALPVGVPADGPPPLTIVITPSMGFGTGHHATTRLCLAALQAADVAGGSVIDVGTGSGVLAIAADRLGARDVLGIDSDPDAIASARENLPLNAEARRTRFEVADLSDFEVLPAEIVTANLTAAVLTQSGGRLARLLAAGGTLIASGFLSAERETVRQAFPAWKLVWHAADGGWAAFALKRPPEQSPEGVAPARRAPRHAEGSEKRT